MKICNKCEIQYPETNLFCKKCHSLLQFKKVEKNASESTEKSESNKRLKLIERTHETDNRKNGTKIKPNTKKHDFFETPVYTEWEPPAPTTLYGRIKNIPYGVLKYNLSRGFYTNGIRQIESCINNRIYSCDNCSYYTNFDYELCSLKKIKVISNAICKSFELKPEYHIDSSNVTYEKENITIKEETKGKKKKKDKKKYRCVTCLKMFRTEESLEKHRQVRKH